MDQGNAVEEPAVEVPLCHEGGVEVVEELKVGDEEEGVVLDDVRGVGCRMDEQGEGHFVPDGSCLGVDVEFAELAQVEALVDASLREVVVVLSAKESVDASSVGEREDGGVVVDLHTALLGVDVSDVGLVGDTSLELGGGDV